MFKFLDPTGATYFKGERFAYILPRQGQKWSDITWHPEPAMIPKYNPNIAICGYGRLHLAKELNALFAPENWWVWWARGHSLVGENDRKASYHGVQLRVITPKVLARALRPPFNWGYKAMLGGIHLPGANLSQANLYNAILRDSDLTNTDLSEADMQKAYLVRANMADTNLHHADLRDANLSYANLEGADLTGALLDWANLSNAILCDADLSGASLRHANLNGTNLRGACLIEADMSMTVWGGVK